MQRWPEAADSLVKMFMERELKDILEWPLSPLWKKTAPTSFPLEKDRNTSQEMKLDRLKAQCGGGQKPWGTKAERGWAEETCFPESALSGPPEVGHSPSLVMYTD